MGLTAESVGRNACDGKFEIQKDNNEKVIALAGNPNSGKTTMFNALTGKNERVGNWAGVTVEKKTRNIKKRYCKHNDTLVAVDLPGAYSMSPFTSEESVTSDYIKNEK